MAVDEIRKFPRNGYLDSSKYYTSGSNALQVAPQESKLSEAESARQLIRYRLQTYQQHQNRARMMNLTMAQMVVLTVSMLVIAVFCTQIVYLESMIVKNKLDIKAVNRTISELQVQSDLLETQLSMKVDLNMVYCVATERLGMVYPSRDQIIYFDTHEPEYVRQFEAIPTTD